MTLDEVLWARHEFLKLYCGREFSLTLVASDKELDECIRGIGGIRFSQNLAAETTLMGMRIEKQAKGWHVRDSKGNTIGKT